MNKCLSLMLSALVAVGMCAQAAAPGQPRFARNSALSSTELKRSASTAETRDGSANLRRIPTAGRSVFAAPVSGIAPTTVKAVAKGPMARVSASLNAYGAVIFSSTWTESTMKQKMGLYKLPVVAGAEFSQLFQTPSPVFAYYNDGKYYVMYELAYGSYVMGYDLYVYDTATNENVNVIEFDDLPLKATDVACDPVSGRVYGFFSGDYYGEVYRYWGYLDVNRRTPVAIADMDFSLRAVAIDKHGQAYGIDLAGNLYKIAKETGTFELVGATGCPSLYYMSSAAYNDKDNTIILAYCNDEGAGLVEINPATAASNIISTFANEEEVIGMYIPVQAPDNAPAEPTMAVTCKDGSMTADFTVTMPSKLYSGADMAEGTTLGYKIYSDGAEIAAGEAVAGTSFARSIAIAESGMHTFTVTASNEAGESTAAKASCYIGKGVPQAVSNVVLSYADGSFKLTWAAVTASADGGYLDPAQVVYDVVDSEGNSVASGLTACEWTKAQAIPDELTTFVFGVVARYDAKSSNAAMSNGVTLGHYNVPLSVDMKSKANFDLHTIADANKDGKTWRYSSSKGTYYSYGNDNADDWLFSPAVYLEAGKAYDFKAVAHAYGDKYPERIEIRLGSAPDAGAMTTVLVEPTELLKADKILPAAIAPAESGEYYIGFHAVSDGGQWDLTLVSYSISEPYGADAPDAVTGLKIVPAVSGDLNATVSFIASAKTVTGAEYTGDMKVTVLRDGESVKEMTVAAGSENSFTDNVPEAGRYTYTVEAYSLAGNKGRSASATSFVGPNVPNPPAGVTAVETAGKDGELTLTWEHPATDVDGNPLLPANLAYNVFVYDAEAKDWKKLNDQPVTALTYTFTAQAPTAPQTFVQVGVQTLNCGVAGEYLAGAGLVPVGPAYTLPAGMSSITDIQEYIVGIDPWDGCEFGMKADGDMNAVVSQDGDGQFFYGERVGSSTELGSGKGRGDFIFGKFSLEGTQHPVFTMYTWKITDTDQSKLDLFIVSEGVTTLVETISYENDTDGQWARKTIDLSAYAGKTVQPIIRYHSNGLVYCFFDNIRIADLPDYDLGAVSVSAPKEVEPGEEFDVDVVVENIGRLAAGKFDVELSANGKVVATKSADGIEPGTTATVSFAQSLNMASGTSVEYSATVVFNGDADLSNNTTAKTATVERVVSELPSVSNLAGSITPAGNVITWDAITDADIPYDRFFESFENAEAFTKEYPGWTFVDRDKLPSGNLGNIEIPNHNGEVDAESFIVFDGNNEAFTSTTYAKEYRAADGRQYLGSIYALEGPQQLGTCDDWAISPLLRGDGQTVTFKGKNVSINYSEYIQVWYATEDTTDPDKFVQLKSFNNLGADYRVVRTDGWGDFAFTLPEGAVRFAIRVVSDDGMMFMLDAVEYTAADAVKGLELTGYNVYCNGELITPAPVAVNTFTHADADKNIDNIYHVSAVYNRGESEAKSVTVAKSSGIDTLGSALSITTAAGRIIVTGAANSVVTIAATDGKVLYAAQGDASVSVASGLYLVNVNGTTTKVVVR